MNTYAKTVIHCESHLSLVSVGKTRGYFYYYRFNKANFHDSLHAADGIYISRCEGMISERLWLSASELYLYVTSRHLRIIFDLAIFQSVICSSIDALAIVLFTYLILKR
jgi:hypothetical protein